MGASQNNAPLLGNFNGFHGFLPHLFPASANEVGHIDAAPQTHSIAVKLPQLPQIHSGLLLQRLVAVVSCLQEKVPQILCISAAMLKYRHSMRLCIFHTLLHRRKYHFIKQFRGHQRS